MDKTTLVLEIKVSAEHGQGTDTIFVRREDSELFFRALEQQGVMAVRHETVGEPFVPFWFDSPDQADAIFKMWAADY